MKPKNISLLVGVIFAIAGLSVLTLSGFLFVGSQKFIKNSIVANGTVTEIVQKVSKGSDNTKSYTYSPMVSFTDGSGKEYSFVSGVSSNPSPYHVGDNIKILYSPQNPYDAKIDKFFELWGGVIIAFILGIVFSIVGIGMVAWFAKRSAGNNWLKSNGQTVDAVVQSVGVDEGVKYNGRSPYVVISQWVQPSSNSVYIFKSESTWTNPEGYVKPGDKIKVIIDPSNPKKYSVDISFLPSAKN
jgi:hypothetical protein